MAATARAGRLYASSDASSAADRSPLDRTYLGTVEQGRQNIRDQGGDQPRYGDLTLAILRNNPGLLADRAHLLALRDVLAGDGAQLDWSVAITAGAWEGVTVGGSPPRVTGLDLARLGLTEEIWGWLGDLSALEKLRLNGNALTGTLPSKLSLLGNLTDVRLAGNDLEGCLLPSAAPGREP